MSPQIRLLRQYYYVVAILFASAIPVTLFAGWLLGDPVWGCMVAAAEAVCAGICAWERFALSPWNPVPPNYFDVKIRTVQPILEGARRLPTPQ
jgi:hypothetical protein